MGKYTRSSLILLVLLLLAACSGELTTASSAPVVTPSAIPQKPSIIQASPTPLPNVLLKTAIQKLQGASAFQMDEQSIRHYQIHEKDDRITTVYGEFHNLYSVSRQPQLDITIHREYRYSPSGAFSLEESEITEKEGKVFLRQISPFTTDPPAEMNRDALEPFNGDVYQTLVQYSDAAVYNGSNGDTAEYILDHPEWYRLQGAVGFANLGFLSTQPDSGRLIEEYVQQNYPDVKTIRFILRVDIARQEVKEVIIEDGDFMLSVWKSVKRAAAAQGGKINEMPEYRVLEDNGTTVTFTGYP
jgi:hypothetical protein